MPPIAIHRQKIPTRPRPHNRSRIWGPNGKYRQQTNQTAGVTGGRPEMIETIARAGIVNNIDGLFIETHFDPSNAKSDGANMLHLDKLEALLTNLVAIRKTINNF